MLLRALTHKRPGPPTRYAYIAPTQAQAKDIAWGYLKSFTGRIPGVSINESDLKVTFADGAGPESLDGGKDASESDEDVKEDKRASQ